MNKIIFFMCMFLSVLVLHARAIQEDFRLADEKAGLSYAIGMYYGSNLRTLPFELEFDYNALAEGFKAMLENDIEPRFSEQEAIEIIETAIYNGMERIAEQNRRSEEEFLAVNSLRPEIQITPNGLQYEILVETEGKKPDENSIVAVYYTGAFTDGTIFDMSDDDGAYIPLDMVIPGWTEGLMLMSEGSIYRLYVPSYMAYGRDGVQNIIPPYSTLIFTVELLEILDLDIMDFASDYNLSEYDSEYDFIHEQEF